MNQRIEIAMCTMHALFSQYQIIKSGGKSERKIKKTYNELTNTSIKFNQSISLIVVFEFFFSFCSHFTFPPNNITTNWAIGFCHCFQVENSEWFLFGIHGDLLSSVFKQFSFTFSRILFASIVPFRLLQHSLCI